MSTPEENSTSSTQRENILIRIRKDFIGTLFISLALMLAAGRLNWTMGWLYIGLNFLGLLVNWGVLAVKNPAVFASRADITKEDSKTWDKVFTSIYGPLLLVIMAVTGLDGGRFGWSNVPAWLQFLSIGLFILGWGFSLWALVTNKFFETSVRIQQDRGQTTVTSGPYAIVRHPGYAGIALLYAVSPLILGSWWGMIPAAVLTIAFFLRTAMEDRTLQEELPDYAAYAQKVRYRLLPGIW